jgi:signal transduction histidine kinase
VVALVGVLAAALGNSAAAGSREAGDYVFPVILLGVPWAAGRALRRWRERTEELQEVTTALREEREQHARLAVAAERGRIARELHDSLAQSLNAVVVHTEVAEASLGRDEARVATSLGRIGAVARSSLGETRRLLDALRDLADGDSPRLEQLATLVEDWRADGLQVDLQVEADASGLPPSVEAAVFRIVQESLTNVATHSCAGSARVRVCLGDPVTLRVEDDGPAVASAGPSRAGLGLLGMRERAVLLGGDFRVGPDGDGFLVEATIPREART